MRYFLIDDDPDDQEIFCLAIHDVEPTIDCIRTNDGVQALQKLNTIPHIVPHCIFIDMNMPRMNGIQCLLEIRKIDRLKDVPIYLCSTSSDPRMIAETKAMGAIDFIIKPSNIRDFTNILAAIHAGLKPSS
ncbi:response regulator [Chryseolinea lacunae]|nr:response regulator [Chryseolinea lacunae]